jgi:hypothetical protein
MVLGLLASGFHHPASAQSAIGGPKKPTAIGGAAKQSSPVVPTSKGATVALSEPSHSKCPAGPCVAKGSGQQK